MKKKYAPAFLLLTAAMSLTACELIPFEDPEEQRAKAEITEAVVVLPDPREALGSDRVYHQELRNQAGTLLATYETRMPNFSEAEPHGEIFREINGHYDLEFSESTADSESLFQVVERHHGPEWEVLETVDGVFSVRYTYELLSTPEKYICIQKKYTYQTDLGGGYTRYYPDVFLAENGWRLSFGGLFGHNADKASGMALAGIRAWCEENDVPHEKLDGLTAADFTDFYAMDTEYLIFYAEPFMFSTNDGTAYVIKLNIRDFSGMFIE